MNFANFQCNQRYKCVGSFCIPYHRVCDGINDCSYGDDELSCQIYTCHGMLRCQGAFCVHPKSICNGHNDCPGNDDETNCDQTTCHKKCICKNDAVYCKHGELQDISPTILFAKFIRFYKCTPSVAVTLSQVLNHLQILMHLNASYNNLSVICRMDNETTQFGQLHTLDLSHNSLKEIQKHCFYSTQNLIILLLAYNKIFSLHLECFTGLTILKSLDLSFNLLTSLRATTFSVVRGLKLLNLLGNEIQMIDEKFNNPMLVNTLTTRYLVCCYVQSKTINCSAKAAYLSSCDELLSILPMKIIIMVVGLTALGLNSGNLLFRISPRYEIGYMDYNIISIAITDGLLGLYLLFIASADLYYRGNFVGRQVTWLKSPACSTATFFYTSSTFSSVIDMSLLSIIRFASVQYPMKAKIDIFPKMPIIIKVSKILLITLSIGVVCTYHIIFGESPNSICILITFGKTNYFLKFLTVMTAVVQLIGLCVIFFCYITVKLGLRKATFDDEKVATDNRRTLSTSVFLAMTSNIICWLPSAVIFLIALQVHNLPPELMIWNVIVVIPINATLNPIIFLFGTLHHKKKKSKIVTSKEHHEHIHLRGSILSHSKTTSSEIHESSVLDPTGVPVTGGPPI